MSPTFQIPIPKPGPYLLGPDSQRQPGVPQGIITQHSWKSSIFPGTHRDYCIYVPQQYSPDQPASVMVFQDGCTHYAKLDGDTRVPIVFDNLIHQGRMPVTIGIFINPGYFPALSPEAKPISNRIFEYDTLSDQYARFIIEEMLPTVGAQYNLTTDPNQRAIAGGSSGGVCAFTVAWQRPDIFRKVLSHIGSYTDIRGGHAYPILVRKTPAKPIRIYLQAGSTDLDLSTGSWTLGNLQMAASLQFAGYDYRFEYGEEGHSHKHPGACMPESLIWLWR